MDTTVIWQYSSSIVFIIRQQNFLWNKNESVIGFNGEAAMKEQKIRANTYI